MAPTSMNRAGNVAEPRDRLNSYLALLEGLAQRLQDHGRELTHLVQEEGPAVGQGDLHRVASTEYPLRSWLRETFRGEGREKGGRSTNPPGDKGRPATEWIRVTSRAVRRSNDGRSPARRWAARLPDPGGPIIRRWCPPAAATSSARRARRCPRTSDRSGPVGLDPSPINALVSGDGAEKDPFGEEERSRSLPLAQGRRPVGIEQGLQCRSRPHVVSRYHPRPPRRIRRPPPSGAR